MAEETEPATPAPEPTLVERLEADVEEVKAAVEAVPAEADAKVAQIHAHFDAFREEVRAYVSALIPTVAHNTLMSFVESLRAKVLSLL